MTRRLTLKINKMVTRNSIKKSKISSKPIKKAAKIVLKDKLKKKVLKVVNKNGVLPKKKNAKKEKIDDSNLLELGLLLDCTGSMSSWI